EFNLRILAINRLFDERPLRAPAPNIEMDFAAEAGELKRKVWTHLPFDGAIVECGFARREPKIAKRNFHCARRFGNLAWDFHLKKNRFAAGYVHRLNKPDARSHHPHEKRDRDPHGSCADKPLE